MSDLFRKKSLDRISSPEQLDDYIHVTSPSVVLVLAALILILLGMFAWGILGRVPVEGADGVTKIIAPITLLTN